MNDSSSNEVNFCRTLAWSNCDRTRHLTSEYSVLLFCSWNNQNLELASSSALMRDENDLIETVWKDHKSH